MKRLFFFMAAALVMVACNKNKADEPTNPDPKPQQDTTVVTKNLIHDQFDEMLPLVGLKKSDYEAAMKKAGYEKYEGTEIYGKSTANTISEVSSSVNGSDVVYKITCSIRPFKNDSSKYEPQMTVEYVKDVIVKIGNNCEMGADKINCRFLATYNQIGQKICSSPSDFEKVLTAGNLNGTKTYYVDAKIEQWNPESTVPYVGIIMNVQDAIPVQGSTATEFSVAFEFSDMTKAE